MAVLNQTRHAGHRGANTVLLHILLLFLYANAAHRKTHPVDCIHTAEPKSDCSCDTSCSACVDHAWSLEKARSLLPESSLSAGLGAENLSSMLDKRYKDATIDYSTGCTSFDRVYKCTVASTMFSGYKFQMRKVCQDRVLVHEVRDYLILAVFDGHGTHGEKMAEFCRREFVKCFIDHEHAYNDAKLGLKYAFVSLHQQMAEARQSLRDIAFSGTTATVAVISKNKTLYIANVGDSSCYLASEGSLLRVSQEHNYESTDEVARIQSFGGVVSQMEINGTLQGPKRVYSNRYRVSPGLAVSRTLGDYEAHAVGVSEYPDIVEIELKDSDTHLILASDGLWDMLSPAYVYATIAGDVGAESVEKVCLESAKRWIYDRTGIVDDICVIAVQL